MARPLNRRLLVVADVAAAAREHLIRAQPRTLALAGGNTPRALYECLSHGDLPWAAMDICFGDERCVPPSDERLNYGMARGALLSRVPARAHPMPTEPCTPEPYEDVLRSIFGGYPTFDLVLLGLGEDGHTASLFPHDPALHERERWVAAVDGPDIRRLTLTLPVLSAAREALFLVTGAAKRPALDALMRGEDIPAARVTASSITVIAGHEAAAGLEGGLRDH